MCYAHDECGGDYTCAFSAPNATGEGHCVFTGHKDQTEAQLIVIIW